MLSIYMYVHLFGYILLTCNKKFVLRFKCYWFVELQLVFVVLGRAQLSILRGVVARVVALAAYVSP